MYFREVQPQSPDSCSFLPVIKQFLPLVVLPLNPTAVAALVTKKAPSQQLEDSPAFPTKPFQEGNQQRGCPGGCLPGWVTLQSLEILGVSEVFFAFILFCSILLEQVPRCLCSVLQRCCRHRAWLRGVLPERSCACQEEQARCFAPLFSLSAAAVTIPPVRSEGARRAAPHGSLLGDAEAGGGRGVAPPSGSALFFPLTYLIPLTNLVIYSCLSSVACTALLQAGD